MHLLINCCQRRPSSPRWEQLLRQHKSLKRFSEVEKDTNENEQFQNGGQEEEIKSEALEETNGKQLSFTRLV
jgi:hypothetical protein